MGQDAPSPKSAEFPDSNPHAALTTPAPIIALIFINWNTPRLLIGAVESLLALPDDQTRYRLIVVDNGSTDDSMALFRRDLQAMVDDHQPRLGGLDILEQGRNSGFARAVNRGLETVTEPHALILNTDVEFLDSAPPLLVEALAADPQAALACPRLKRPDGSDQAAARPLNTILSELTYRSFAHRLLQRRLPLTRPSVVPSVVGPCMAVKMERLRDVGFFDERFFFFYEETDLCKRLNDAGHHIIWVPAAEVVHLQGASANTRPYRARIQFFESRYRYYRKHSSTVACALLTAGLLLRLTVNLVARLVLVVVSLGRQKHRDKLALYAVVLAWHLRGCPHGQSFEPEWCWQEQDDSSPS